MINFPGLGIEFEISREAFQIFGFPIYWYSIIISLAILASLLLALRECKKYDIDSDTIIDVMLYSFIPALIGARLYYIVFNLNDFINDPIKIINPRLGGLAIYGGIIAAFLVALIYSKIKKINYLKLFDFVAPYFILSQAIGRWGNFINKEAFGSITKLPWRMKGEAINLYIQQSGYDINDSQIGVHPTFLYESLWNIGVFLFLIWFRKKKKLNGEVFFLYLIGYGLGRFFIEGLRTDSLMIFDTVRVSQAVSLLLIIIFGFIFIKRRWAVLSLASDAPETGLSEYGQILEQMKSEETSDESAEEEAKANTLDTEEEVEGEIPKSNETEEEISEGDNSGEEIHEGDNSGEEIHEDDDSGEKIPEGDDSGGEIPESDDTEKNKENNNNIDENKPINSEKEKQ